MRPLDHFAIVRCLFVVLIAIVGGSIAGRASGATHQYDVLVDADNSAATGCPVATPLGSVPGVDTILRVTVVTSASNATVTQVTRRDCVAGSFGAAASVSGGSWPV